MGQELDRIKTAEEGTRGGIRGNRKQAVLRLLSFFSTNYNM
jgi:hypothetical protein